MRRGSTTGRSSAGRIPCMPMAEPYPARPSRWRPSTATPSRGSASCATTRCRPPDGVEFDWNWKAAVQPRPLHRAARSCTSTSAAGSRRIVVDGIEPMDVPGDYIQPYIFDDLYRKTIHRDSETLGMEICLPVWKHRAFIDAPPLRSHRGDHAPARDHRGDPARAPHRPQGRRRATSARWPTPSW